MSSELVPWGQELVNWEVDVGDAPTWCQDPVLGFFWATCEQVRLTAGPGRAHVRLESTPKPPDLACLCSDHSEPPALVRDYFGRGRLLAGRSSCPLLSPTGPAHPEQSPGRHPAPPVQRSAGLCAPKLPPRAGREVLQPGTNSGPVPVLTPFVGCRLMNALPGQTGGACQGSRPLHCSAVSTRCMRS